MICGRVRLFILLLGVSLFTVQLKAHLKQGQKLTYDVTFGNILKGHAVVKYHGSIASYTETETLTVLADSAMLEAGLPFLSESTLVIDADSIIEYSPADSTNKTEHDSASIPPPKPITVLREKVHDIFYISYDTHFVGNLYHLHADIFTDSVFTPLLIETQITRTGKKSQGEEQFFPAQNMAIFSQRIEGILETDTIIRQHPLQDVTTLPFYLSNMEHGVGTTLDVSLAQGEYNLSYVDEEIIEYGEGHDYRYYHTYRIESEPEGFKLWLSKNNKIPVKVYIESQKINMILAKREIDKSIPAEILSEQKVMEKLRHIFPPQ